MYNSSDWAKERERLEAERDRLLMVNEGLVKALDTLLTETVSVLTTHFANPRHDMIEDVPSIKAARAALDEARQS